MCLKDEADEVLQDGSGGLAAELLVLTIRHSLTVRCFMCLKRVAVGETYVQSVNRVHDGDRLHFGELL